MLATDLQQRDSFGHEMNKLRTLYTHISDPYASPLSMSIIKEHKDLRNQRLTKKENYLLIKTNIYRSLQFKLI